MLNQRGRSISARRATGAEEAESEHPENEMKNAPAVVTGAMLYPTEKCTKTATCTTKLYMQMFLFDPFRFSLKIVLYIASLFMGRVSKMSVLFSLSLLIRLCFFCFVFSFIYWIFCCCWCWPLSPSLPSPLSSVVARFSSYVAENRSSKGRIRTTGSNTRTLSSNENNQ